MNSNKKENGDERLEPSPGVLYVVGTPIGNLGDLSPRARSILREVSSIACEDTRHSGHMLNGLGVKAPLISFYKHNTQSRHHTALNINEEECSREECSARKIRLSTQYFD